MACDVLCVGEALLAVVPEPATRFRRSEVLHRFTVGAEVNVAVGIARSGLNAEFAGRIGSDLPGSAIRDDLLREGVGISDLLIDEDAPTGMLSRQIDALGNVEVSYNRRGSAGSRLMPEDLRKHAVESARIVHVSGVTPALSSSAEQTTEALLAMAGAAGVRRSFDMNYRSRLWSPAVAAPVLRTLAASANILIGGVDEYALVFGEADPERALARAEETGPTLLIMTAGTEPVRMRVAGHTEELPVAPTRAVDPVGAGDGFVAGLLAGLLSGMTERDAVAQGMFVGRSVVSALGDWTGLPWGRKGRIDQVDSTGAVIR